MSVERFRIDRGLHPFFAEGGEAAFFLARRVGRPAGRISAQKPRDTATGWFGFFECVDDPAVAAALVGAATAWLGARGATRLEGPYSLTPTDEAGLRVGAFDQPAVTGLPWHPRHYARRLAGTGMRPGPAERWSRLDLGGDGAGPVPPSPRLAPSAPAEATVVPAGLAPYRDAMVTVGDGDVVIIPDLIEELAGLTLRTAWRHARRARTGRFPTGVARPRPGVVLDADRLDELAAAARAAGYRRLWVPAMVPGAPTLAMGTFSARV